MAVNLEAVLATNPSITPKVLAEINEVANYILWTKTRYEISLRVALLGEGDSLDTTPNTDTNSNAKHSHPAASIDVDGLLRSLMESEGQEAAPPVTVASSFGMVDWGYFYDPQVVDGPTETVLEGDEPPQVGGDGDGDSTTPSTANISRIHGVRPPRHGQTSAFIKPPVLLETRKLVEAYLAQITPALNLAADTEQWAGTTKGK